jgi:alanine racemase
MSRIGLPASDAGVEEGVKIASFENLAVEGIFTHFAKADEKDKTFSKMQYDRFTKMIHAFEERGLTFSLRHCANSASIIDLPEFHLDAVRAGITLYGLWPSDEVQKEKLPIKPAMRLVSHIAHVKTVPAQTPVSYGGTFVTEKETVIATIPTGYGDGYPRSLSNKGWCLIGGKKAPILGRVCMDQFMADVTKIPEAKIGTEVVLIGDTLTMETVGDLSGRFNYELACDIGSRVPRVFVKDQKIVAERFF